MVDRLHSAHTLTYSIVNKTGMETMPTVRTQRAFKEPGYLRTSTADGYVTVVHASEAGVRGLNLVPLQKKYMTFEFTNVPDTPDTGPYVSVEKLRALPGQADEALGRRQIDGRTLEGYQVHETDMTTTVWVDPRTGEPARVEMEFAAAPGMDMVLSDFQFDVTLDDSLFSLEPPAGYEPMGFDLQADMDEVGEKDLIAFLRLWSSWTADRTFPPTLTGTEIGKIAMQMGQEGKFTGSSGFDRDQEAKIMYNGMVFLGKLPSGSWRYAGQKRSFRDPQTPILWYCPEGCSDLAGDLRGPERQDRNARKAAQVAVVPMSRRTGAGSRWSLGPAPLRWPLRGGYSDLHRHAVDVSVVVDHEACYSPREFAVPGVADGGRHGVVIDVPVVVPVPRVLIDVPVRVVALAGIERDGGADGARVGPDLDGDRHAGPRCPERYGDALGDAGGAAHGDRAIGYAHERLRDGDARVDLVLTVGLDREAGRIERDIRTGNEVSRSRDVAALQSDRIQRDLPVRLADLKGDIVYCIRFHGQCDLIRRDRQPGRHVNSRTSCPVGRSDSPRRRSG